MECAERSRRAIEPILWYHGTFRFIDHPQWRASRDEVVGLESSFGHLPPVLKPCFPVALCWVVIHDMGGDICGASPFDDGGWHLRGDGDGGRRSFGDFDNQLGMSACRIPNGRTEVRVWLETILPFAMLELSVHEPSAPCLLPRRRRWRSMPCLMALIFPWRFRRPGSRS